MKEKKKKKLSLSKIRKNQQKEIKGGSMALRCEWTCIAGVEDSMAVYVREQEK